MVIWLLLAARNPTQTNSACLSTCQTIQCGLCRCYVALPPNPESHVPPSCPPPRTEPPPQWLLLLPTRSRGIRRSSEPCFRNTLPASQQQQSIGMGWRAYMAGVPPPLLAGWLHACTSQLDLLLRRSLRVAHTPPHPPAVCEGLMPTPSAQQTAAQHAVRQAIKTAHPPRVLPAAHATNSLLLPLVLVRACLPPPPAVRQNVPRLRSRGLLRVDSPQGVNCQLSRSAETVLYSLSRSTTAAHEYPNWGKNKPPPLGALLSPCAPFVIMALVCAGTLNCRTHTKAAAAAVGTHTAHGGRAVMGPGKEVQDSRPLQRLHCARRTRAAWADKRHC